MARLLSITIPTFNRSQELDRQLGWLAQELEGWADDCEIIISDNCSTDATSDVIAKWQPILAQQADFRWIRNSENIGLMNNLAQCLNIASGRFVWTVGDDDPIQPGTLGVVMRALQERSDLTLLLLNYAGRAKPSNELVGERWLPELDWAGLDGKTVFQQCIETSIVNALFLTATVYRTEHVQASLKQWPESVQSWGGQAFWTGYCAAQGSVMLTQESYMECIMGASQWEKEPGIWEKIFYRDTPEIYVKLWEIGYSHHFCRRMVLQNLLANQWIQPYDWRSYARALKKWPRATIAIIRLLLVSSLLSVLETLSLHKLFTQKPSVANDEQAKAVAMP